MFHVSLSFSPCLPLLLRYCCYNYDIFNILWYIFHFFPSRVPHSKLACTETHTKDIQIILVYNVTLLFLIYAFLSASAHEISGATAECSSVRKMFFFLQSPRSARRQKCVQHFVHDLTPFSTFPHSHPASSLLRFNAANEIYCSFKLCTRSPRTITSRPSKESFRCALKKCTEKFFNQPLPFVSEFSVWIVARERKYWFRIFLNAASHFRA